MLLLVSMNKSFLRLSSLPTTCSRAAPAVLLVSTSSSFSCAALPVHDLRHHHYPSSTSTSTSTSTFTSTSKSKPTALFFSSSLSSSSASASSLATGIRTKTRFTTVTTGISTTDTKTLVKRTMSSSNSNSSNINSDKAFQAWRVEKQDDGTFVGCEQTLLVPQQDDNDNESDNHTGNDVGSVLIKVTHSSLNYKDALSSSGTKGGVTRNFPHTPGIDAAGYIVNTISNNSDNNDDGNDGTSVLVTGYDLGMNTDGGYGEYIRVPKEWIVSPNPFIASNNDDDGGDDGAAAAAGAETTIAAAARTAMIYGTAGLTAALSVDKLLTVGNAKPSDGKVIVTGASGSVGSVAVELLSKLGFHVVAISGTCHAEKEKKELLIELGANEVLGRDALEATKKPMVKPIYAHGIDTVGGSPLAELVKQIKNGGSVTCCGNVAGMELQTTVLPFILRGIQLLGIDSVMIPLEDKRTIWNRLATTWKCPKIEESAKYIGRNELDYYLKSMLNTNGQSKSLSGPGKIVLDHSITTTKNRTSSHNKSRL